MRILIEATQAFLRYRGWGRYNRELLAALLESGDENEYFVFYNRFGLPDGDFRESLLSPNATVFPFDYSREEYDRLEEDETRSFLDETFPTADVYHSVTEFPFFTSRMPTLTTVHEITPVLQPQNRTPAFVTEFEKSLRAAVSRSAWIATPSQSTRLDLIHHFGADPKRVKNIPNGAADVFFDAGTLERPPFPPQSFLLFVGATSDRDKRFDWLLEALPLLPSWVNLVVVDDCVIPEVLKTRVTAVGKIADQKLRSLYRQARLLVLPSVHEGFGLPLVEAMAARCPILAADNSSMTEIVLGRGELFPTESRVGFVEALLRCLQDYPTERIEAAHEFARKHYRWSRSAAAYRHLYHQIREQRG